MSVHPYMRHVWGQDRQSQRLSVTMKGQSNIRAVTMRAWLHLSPILWAGRAAAGVVAGAGVGAGAGEGVGTGVP